MAAGGIRWAGNREPQGRASPGFAAARAMTCLRELLPPIFDKEWFCQCPTTKRQALCRCQIFPWLWLLRSAASLPWLDLLLESLRSSALRSFALAGFIDVFGTPCSREKRVLLRPRIWLSAVRLVEGSTSLESLECSIYPGLPSLDETTGGPCSILFCDFRDSNTLCNIKKVSIRKVAVNLRDRQQMWLLPKPFENPRFPMDPWRRSFRCASIEESGPKKSSRAAFPLTARLIHSMRSFVLARDHHLGQ